MLCGPGEEDGADDNCSEREHTEHASDASWERLVEERHAGGDRGGVGEEGGDAGRGECAAALEAELKHDEAEPVRGK
jgi:hypothetical protein